MKKYSFVIPTYQSKNMIFNTLAAISRLKGIKKDKYEVVIVDDGSTDGTKEAVKDIKASFDIKYIYLERNADSCRSRARNVGWKCAEGERIIFIDADILVKDDYLSELERYFSVKKDLLVVGTRIMIPEAVSVTSVKDGSVFDKFKFSLDNKELIEFRHDIFNELSYNSSRMDCPFLYCLSCNLALPKKWLESIGGFDEDLKKWGVEDIEMVYRAYKQGIKIVLNSKLEVFHQFHGFSGIFVDEDKLEGVRENTEIFLRKNKGAFRTTSDIEIYELFNSIATRFTVVEETYKINKPEIIIDFYDKEQLQEVKQAILELCIKNDYKILVNDFVEDTDLDIWIQLLDCCNPPAYYPVSRKIRKDIILGRC